MIEVKAVLGVIGEDESTRRAVMAKFKAAGGSLDKWSRADRARMADAITHAEDQLELANGGPGSRVRERLRAIRRRLEDDLELADSGQRGAA